MPAWSKSSNPMKPGDRMLGRWNSLSAEERSWLLRATCALPLLKISLALRGYNATVRRIEQPRSAASRTVGRTDLERAERLARIAEIAGRRGISASTCLPQALWIYRMLRSWGLRPVLRLGVRRQPGTMQAHAWVELDGNPLGVGSLGHVAIHQSLPPDHAPSAGP